MVGVDVSFYSSIKFSKVVILSLKIVIFVNLSQKIMIFNDHWFFKKIMIFIDLLFEKKKKETRRERDFCLSITKNLNFY